MLHMEALRELDGVMLQLGAKRYYIVVDHGHGLADYGDAALLRELPDALQDPVNTNNNTKKRNVANLSTTRPASEVSLSRHRADASAEVELAPSAGFMMAARSGSCNLQSLDTSRPSPSEVLGEGAARAALTNETKSTDSSVLTPSIVSPVDDNPPSKKRSRRRSNVPEPTVEAERARAVEDGDEILYDILLSLDPQERLSLCQRLLSALSPEDRQLRLADWPSWWPPHIPHHQPRALSTASQTTILRHLIRHVDRANAERAILGTVGVSARPALLSHLK